MHSQIALDEKEKKRKKREKEKRQLTFKNILP